MSTPPFAMFHREITIEEARRLFPGPVIDLEPKPVFTRAPIYFGRAVPARSTTSQENPMYSTSHTHDGRLSGLNINGPEGRAPSAVQSAMISIAEQQRRIEEALDSLRRDLSLVSRSQPPQPEGTGTATPPIHASPLVLGLKDIEARNSVLLRLIATIRDEVVEVAP